MARLSLFQHAFAASSLAVAACSAEAVDDRPAVRVGLIAPFSGPFAATGANVERVVLTLMHAVNDEPDGLADGRLEVIAKDSHSEVARGLEGADALFADDSVLAVVGPEENEIIASLQAAQPHADWAQMLPGMTADDVVLRTDPRWFRVGPSPEGVACALAERIYDLGYRKIAVVYGPDRVSVAFAESIGVTLDDYALIGPAQWNLLPVGAAATTNETIRALDELTPDAVILAASTELGAQAAQDILVGVLKQDFDWFLAPSLLNEIFVLNIPPGALEGAMGLGPAVAFEDDARGLSDAVFDGFADRPFEASYFYYDAMALLVLSIERAYREVGDTPTREEIRQQVSHVARPPGMQVRWNDLPLALDAIRQGEDIDYVGITGNLTLDASGTIDYTAMQYRQQRLVDGKLAFETSRVCIPVH